MANSRTVARVVGGCLVAGMMLVAFGEPDALAARKKKRRRRAPALSVQRVNIADQAGVAGNAIIEVVFSAEVDPSTVNHAQFQVRGENATQKGYTRAVFGTFQTLGNVVRFYPRLQTHLRDPSSSRNDFYPEGSSQDDAAENAGLQPNTNYEIRILGKDTISPIRSKRGRPLRKSAVTFFTTAAASSPATQFTTTTYQDSPPPQFAFSNPPDRVPGPDDQYASRGGTSDVPNALSISMFGTKVPLSPTTARIVGNVGLTLISRKGDPTQRRPIGASIFLEQNFQTTLLVVKPTFPLADLGTYTLRVSKNVRDLTELYDFQPNRSRERLRLIYEELAKQRADFPGLPPEQLDNPSEALIPDWPPESDVVGRGVLKANILALGDNNPDEIDPRVMVLFSTRDEPVTNAEFVINFNKAEDLFDGKLSTAEWDDTVPGAASAIMTVAGGSAADGDFRPSADTTLNLDLFPNYEANFRDVVIPQGVTVTLIGSRPAHINSINFTLNGILNASGVNGAKAQNAGYTSKPVAQKKGGAANLGGGPGGSSNTYFYHPSISEQSGTHYKAGKLQVDPVTKVSNIRGFPGMEGRDFAGVPAEPDDGGRGGLGGFAATGTYYYHMGGGGGGGGAQTAGSTGRPATSPYGSWNGQGGEGGAGSVNDDLDPLTGGGGGGAGGNGVWGYTTFSGGNNGAGGGSGGGALRVQVARTVNVGSFGAFLALGGVGGDGGGNNNQIGPAPAGGGGGGSVLLRTTTGYNIADVSTAFDVSGGLGGTNSGSYVATDGGAGGDGYVRLEDPDGGMQVPGGTVGSFDPVGGGVASFVYTKWADLGVSGPRIVDFKDDDIVTQPTVNDAILVEIQMTGEHPTLFGTPDLSAIDNFQDSTDPSITSDWVPLKVHDNTDNPDGAFGSMPGYSKTVQGSEYTFPVGNALNGMGYRFVRYRMYFQLDDLHARLDQLPFVDQIILHFQFNF